MFELVGIQHLRGTSKSGKDYDIYPVVVLDKSLSENKKGASVVLKNYRIPLADKSIYDNISAYMGRDFNNIYFDANGLLCDMK